MQQRAPCVLYSALLMPTAGRGCGWSCCTSPHGWEGEGGAAWSRNLQGRPSDSAEREVRGAPSGPTQQPGAEGVRGRSDSTAQPANKHLPDAASHARRPPRPRRMPAPTRCGVAVLGLLRRAQPLAAPDSRTRDPAQPPGSPHGTIELPVSCAVVAAPVPSATHLDLTRATDRTGLGPLGPRPINSTGLPWRGTSKSSKTLNLSPSDTVSLLESAAATSMTMYPCN